jgi:hypothetical protein
MIGTSQATLETGGIPMDLGLTGKHAIRAQGQA